MPIEIRVEQSHSMTSRMLGISLQNRYGTLLVTAMKFLDYEISAGS